MIQTLRDRAARAFVALVAWALIAPLTALLVLRATKIDRDFMAFPIMPSILILGAIAGTLQAVSYMFWPRLVQHMAANAVICLVAAVAAYVLPARMGFIRPMDSIAYPWIALLWLLAIVVAWFVGKSVLSANDKGST